VDDDQVRRLVAALDTRRVHEEQSAWQQLRPLGERVVPFLLEYFPRARAWQGRAALVFHSIRYARRSDAAFQLGLEGVRDRSWFVRHRACALLAYSLRRDALPELRPLLKHADARTVADARAAIDAIESQNHHLFQDRTHTGRVFWQVEEGDAPLPGRGPVEPSRER
jgi:hypothetical protein